MGAWKYIEDTEADIRQCQAGCLNGRVSIWDEENSDEYGATYSIKIEAVVNMTNEDANTNAGHFVVGSPGNLGGAEGVRWTTDANACLFMPKGWFPYVYQDISQEEVVAANKSYLQIANIDSTESYTDADGTTWNLVWIVVHGYAKIYVQGKEGCTGYNGPIGYCTPLTWNSVIADNMAANFNTLAGAVPVNGDNYIAISMVPPNTDITGCDSQLILAWVFIDEPLKYNDMGVQGTGYQHEEIR